jgi:hypothetical protein
MTLVKGESIRGDKKKKKRVQRSAQFEEPRGRPKK